MKSFRRLQILPARRMPSLPALCAEQPDEVCCFAMEENGTLRGFSRFMTSKFLQDGMGDVESSLMETVSRFRR